MDGTLDIPSLLGGGQAPSVTSKQGGPSFDDLVRAIMHQESGGDPHAIGKKGERGLMQIMPATAAQYGVRPDQLMDPAINMHVGRQYLSSLWKRYNGNVNKVLTAYNAGPSRADSGVTPESTKKYISSIWNRLGSAVVGTAYADELPPELKGAKEVGAPWGGPTPAAMAGAKPVASPWGDSSNAPDFTGRAKQWVIDQSQNLDKRIDPSGAYANLDKNVLSALLPDTNTGGAVDAALMATGVGEMGLIPRLLIPAAAGAVGAYSRGDNPLSGAAQGGISAIGGELGGAAAGIVGRAALGKGVAEKTTADVGESLSRNLGQRLGLGPVRGAADIESKYAMGQATKAAGDIANRVSATANTLLKGRLLSSGVGPPMTLTDAEEVIEALNEGTYTATGAAKSMQGRGAMTRAAFRLRDDVERQLNIVHPGLGSAWRNSRRDLGAAKTIQQLLRESLNSDTGQLDQPTFEKLLRTKYWDKLNSTLGPQGAGDLLKTIRRGASGPAADIPGREVHGRIGMSLEPHFGFPRTAKPVGNVPAIMNRAATNPIRLPAGMSLNQLLEWFNAPTGGQ